MGNTVIVVGSGAREHALAWKLAQSADIDTVVTAPGNAGTAAVGENVPIGVLELDRIVELATDCRAGLVVIGPEAPLAAGLADRLSERGIPVFGPSRSAARIESSKSWAKSIMNAAGVPTAPSQTVRDMAAANAALDGHPTPVVVKADGLAAGKGVIVAHSLSEAREACRGFFVGNVLGDPVETIVIEAFLEGREVSVLALTDGNAVIPLLPACDYKRAFDGDDGPNTGGMGAYAPAPDLDQLADVPAVASSVIPSEVEESPAVAARPPMSTSPLNAHVPATALDAVRRQILEPTVRAMAEAGAPMQGVLYAGLMITDAGPIVLEFNARFGDPETQVILPLLTDDLYPLLLATATGELGSLPAPIWSGDKAVGVVLASGGYPGNYRTGIPITTGAPHSATHVFHAGTTTNDAGDLVTNGGRVITVVGTGENYESAAERAYEQANAITFEGKQYRRDIARRELSSAALSSRP